MRNFLMIALSAIALCSLNACVSDCDGTCECGRYGCNSDYDYWPSPNREIGEACKWNSDCRSNNCIHDAIGADGVCGVEDKLIGDSCASDDDCKYGYCSKEDGDYSGVCAKLELGAACDWNADCASGYCNVDNDTFQGICVTEKCYYHNVCENVSRDDDKDKSDVRSCERDIQCGIDQLCNDGKCVKAECKINADCKNANDMCSEGRCIPCQTDLCDTSRDIQCVFSSQCESGLCVDGACLAAGKCVINDNCSDGQVCLDGECLARPECLADAECGDGRICNAEHKCEDDVECHVDADCGNSGICLNNMCAQCRLSCECPNKGDICMNGACVSK